jgi:hypothetical protein
MGQESPISSCVSSLLADSVDLNNAELHNKRVLFRVDVNVPLTADHRVADATKITSILPTLQLLLSKRARVVLCSHLGRPDPLTQSPNEMREEFSLAPVAGFLRDQLGADVFTGLTADCVGPAAVQAVDALQPGQVCVHICMHPLQLSVWLTTVKTVCSCVWSSCKKMLTSMAVHNPSMLSGQLCFIMHASTAYVSCKLCHEANIQQMHPCTHHLQT